MIDQQLIDALYEEASCAYEDMVRLTELSNAIKAKTYECEHENARRKKDGARDKRYPCADCLVDRELALSAIDCIEYDYQAKWRLFESMGSPIAKSE